MTIFFKNVQDLLSVSTFICTMIDTNLAYANTIWKHIIIKSLYYLFQNVFTESKAWQKHSSIDVKSVFICYIYVLKLPWNSDNLSSQNIHEQNYMDSAMLSYSCSSALRTTFLTVSIIRIISSKQDLMSR